MDELDRVIEIDNELEPEKGGYYREFMSNFDNLIKMREYCSLDENGRFTNFAFYRDTKPEGISCLNLENGQTLDMPIPKLTPEAFDTSPFMDFRVLGLSTINLLGLEFHNKDEMLKEVQQTTQNNNYFSASTDQGFLVSISEIKDPRFARALNRAAQKNTQQLSFDDAKYEPQFKKLEGYLKYFDLLAVAKESSKLQHDRAYENTKTSVSLEKASENRDFPFSVFKADTDNKVFVPRPVYFRSADEYIKTHCYLIAKYVIASSDNEYASNEKSSIPFSKALSSFTFSKEERDVLYQDRLGIGDRDARYKFVATIASSMLAAQFGVKTTYNDIKKQFFHPCKELAKTDGINQLNDGLVTMFLKKDLQSFFDIAAKLTNHIKSRDIEHFIPDTPTMWSNWKSDHQSLELQLATPSLDELCKLYKIEVNKDQVLTALDDKISQHKTNLEAHKEQLKLAILKDQPDKLLLLPQSSLETSKEQHQKEKTSKTKAQKTQGDACVIEPVKRTKKASKGMER